MNAQQWSIVSLGVILTLLAVRIVSIIRQRNRPSNVRKDMALWIPVCIAVVLVPVAALGILLTVRNFA